MIRFALALALLLAAAPAAAQSPERNRPPTPPQPTNKNNPSGSVSSTPRYAVGTVYRGDHAPDFELPLAGGGKLKLSDLRGKWVVLCFCPQRNYGAVDSIARSVPETVLVIGVFPEKVGTLSAWSVEHKPRALLLDDFTGDIAALYGAYNLEKGEPRAGYAVIEPDGIVNRIDLGQRLAPGVAVRAVQYAVTGL